MMQRVLTLGIAMLAGAGVTLLWPSPTLAAAATLENSTASARASSAELAAPAAAAVPIVRAAAATEAGGADDLTITGPAECIRQLGAALRGAYAEPLRLTCNSDLDALRDVAKGRADAAVVAVAFERTLPDPGLREFTLGDFVVALVRHDENPVRDLSRAQLDELCRGRARGWQDIGGRGSELRAFSTFTGPTDEARALGVAQGLAAVVERGLAADDVIARVQRDRAALGVVALREVDDTLPCIAVDGVQPSANAFAAGSYPFGFRLRLVYRAEHRAGMGKLLTFLANAAGQHALRAR
jgi:hypothetical protein